MGLTCSKIRCAEVAGAACMPLLQRALVCTMPVKRKPALLLISVQEIQMASTLRDTQGPSQEMCMRRLPRHPWVRLPF